MIILKALGLATVMAGGSACCEYSPVFIYQVGRERLPAGMGHQRHFTNFRNLDVLQVENDPKEHVCANLASKILMLDIKCDSRAITFARGRTANKVEALSRGHSNIPLSHSTTFGGFFRATRPSNVANIDNLRRSFPKVHYRAFKIYVCLAVAYGAFNCRFAGSEVSHQIQIRYFIRKFILADHRGGRFLGFLNSVASGLKRPLNKENTRYSSHKTASGKERHHRRPFDHILLRIKVLAGIGFAVGGLYGFGYALAKSETLTTSASGKLLLLCGLVMIAGCYLLALTIYS